VSVVHIRDDRGQRVEAWSVNRSSAGEDADRRLAQLYTAAAASVREPAKEIAINALFILGLVFTVTVLRIGANAQYVAAAFVLPMLGLGWFMARRRRARVTAVMSRTLLSEHRCPSCAYDLTGLRPDDGFSVCPECLSAWRLPEAVLHRPEPPPRDGETAADQRDRQAVTRTLSHIGWARAYTTVDARGRAVKLVSPIPFARRPPAWSELSAPESRRLSRRLYSINSGWRAAGLLVYAMPAYMNLRRISSVAAWSTAGGAVYAIGALIWPVFLLGMLAVPFTRTGKPIVRIMLKEGRCPCCASRLPAARGEIIDCPVCHAAWQSLEWRLGRDSAGHDLLQGNPKAPREAARIAERSRQDPAPLIGTSRGEESGV
jgi:hypothetical protein